MKAFKEHFGFENFYNIFNCFYLLSYIPEDAENNPLAIYMDQKSVIHGFRATFGIYNEEVALRFFLLFIDAEPKKPKQFEIYLIRFMLVV